MKSTILLILPIAAFILLMSSGCTVIGIAVGSGFNPRSGAYSPGTYSSLDDLALGDSVRIITHDERVHTGGYRGKVMPHRDTLARWAEEISLAPCREREDIRLGDEIHVVYQSSHSFDGIFLGANHQAMLVQKDRAAPVSVLPLATIAKITWCEGSRVLLAPMHDAYESGLLEQPESVLLMTEDGWRQYRRQDVATVQYQETRSTGTVVGAAVGLAIDGLIVRLLIESMYEEVVSTALTE